MVTKNTNFEIGKLYKCPEYYLLIYSTTLGSPRRLTSISRLSKGNRGPIPRIVQYWSDILGCTVRCSEPNEIFVFLKEEIIKGERYINVLFGDKQGWIVCKNWLEIRKAEK